MRYAASSLFGCVQLVLDVTEDIFQVCVGSKLTHKSFFKQFGSWDQLCPNFTLSNLCIELGHLKD